MTSTMILTIILSVCFFALMIGIGINSRKHATDVAGFVLGSRSVGPWLSAFAFGTSYFSAVIFVGYAGQFGWNFGLASTWIGLGNAFIGSLLAWGILGRRTRIMTQHLSSNTMPDFFGSRFGSKGLKIAASVITFLFLIPYTASLYNGLSRLFRTFLAYGPSDNDRHTHGQSGNDVGHCMHELATRGYAGYICSGGESAYNKKIHGSV